jgi:hypothetical protein
LPLRLQSIKLEEALGSKPSKVLFGAKFGAIAKSENDMRDMHKVFFFSFYQKQLPQK